MSRTIWGLLFVSVAFNVYFYTSDIYLFDDFESSITHSYDDLVHLSQAAIKKEKNLENEDEFESNRIQQQWFEKSYEFFEKKLKLTEDKITYYHQLRSKRSMELDEYIIPKLDKHYDEHGEDSPYILTMQDSVFMGKLNEKYMNQFKSLIGENAFSEYQKIKSQFNRELTIKNKKEHLIDF